MGSKGSNSPKIPKAPDPVKSYQGFIDAYLKNQPTLQGAEDNTRSTEDPLRIQQQQNLQDQFGPKQYQQMVDAFKQLDPTYFNNREQLGNDVSKNLSGANPYGGLTSPNFNYLSGADPSKVGNAYGGINSNVGNAFNGLNANVGNQYQGLNGNVGNQYGGINSNVGNAFSGINPNANSQYQGAKSLLGNLQSEYALGTQLDPGQQAQVEQGLRGSQAARGNISGTGAGIAEGYALGDRGQQMQQQRLTNLQSGLGQAQDFGQQASSNQFNLANANQGVNQQNFANQMGLAGANQGVNQQNFSNMFNLAGANQNTNQQNYANAYGLANSNQGVNQANFANQMGLGQANQGVNQANFANNLQSGLANIGQGQQNWQNQLGLIDKQTGYNQQQIQNAGSFLGLPNMGTLAAGVPPVSPDRSFSYINPNAGFQGVGLANQGYANQLGAAGLSQNTSGNPWMSAVGALGSVAGGLLASGAFSDRRLKTDIKMVGKDDKGLNLYTFAYKNPKKFIGHMADEVAAHDPSAVAQDPASGYWKVSQEYAPLALEEA